MKKDYSRIINKIENEIKNSSSLNGFSSISINLVKRYMEDNDKLVLDIKEKEKELKEKENELEALESINEGLLARKEEVISCNSSNSSYIKLFEKIEKDEIKINNLKQKVEDLNIKLDLKNNKIQKLSKDKQIRINLENDIAILNEQLDKILDKNLRLEEELDKIKEESEKANKILPKIEGLEEKESIAIKKIDSIWKLLNDDNFDKSFG